VKIMYKMFIADDEYEIRTGLANYFPWNQIGFEVVGTADDGFKTFNYIQQHPVDVLLCDIRMPVMSGIDLAKELHNYGAKVKIVLLSGYREFEYAQKALEYGVKSYIVKPTKYAEVVQIFSDLKKQLDVEAAEVTPDQDLGDGLAGCNLLDEILGKIKLYIKMNYATATLEDAAKLVYMNPYYLSKYFKQKTGENFSDCLTRAKMQNAAKLLKNIAYKTYDVSALVGYTNPKNFARAFKKYYGRSPREFRYQSADREQICVMDGDA